ncbi:hypothetical protein Flavo103_02490 [Flavobacterium collinsii]|uniref:hypothetical protein n=1 Tax=Flavobacterium collinsii TaxID=1114861 RepID=UPI0022CA44C5|nr:hypothetical protein [Flavobacterium collinsii]GIQ57113.1 hypothetical protein Flavo103_02490 [Flavobacterium collinsii]
MHDKLSFITELLSSEKLNLSQKERVLLLTKKELLSLGDANIFLNLKISEIEKKLSAIQSYPIKVISDDEFDTKIEEYLIKNNILGDTKNNLSDTTSPNLDRNLSTDDNFSKSKISYKSPKVLKSFLTEYNQNEILKYTCHLIDSDTLKKIKLLTKTQEYDFEKHLKLIKREFFKLSEKYKSKINKNIRGLIGEYLNNYNDNGWSTYEIKITWSSPELLTWSKENPGKCPNPDPTLNSIPFNFEPIKYDNQQTRLFKFDDLVLLFKSLFHVRRDNSLKASIDIINSTNFSNIYDIDSSNIRENIEFFTDIDKLKQAYKKIIEMSGEFHKKTQPYTKAVFKLFLFENNDRIIFSIHHLNSTFGKTPSSIMVRQGEEISKLIKNQINGVCDLFIKADFGNNEYAEINIWDSNDKKITLIDNFEGVQFDLIFYR